MNVKRPSIYIFKILMMIFCYSSSLYLGQNMDHKKIDSLLLIAENKSKNFQYSESVNLGKDVIKLSESSLYHEGIIKGNFWVASGLCNLGDYKESFIYIERLEKSKGYQEYIDSNPDFNFKLTDLIGRNYLALGFKKQAIKQFRKELVLADLYPSSKEKISQKIFAFIQLSACYEDVDGDSTYYYLNKMSSVLKVNPMPEHNLFLYLNLSDYHKSFTKNVDSVYYYNADAIKLAEKLQSPYLYLALSQKAKILHWQKKCNESLTSCFEVLEIVTRKKRIEDRISLYKLIADNYRCLGDREKELLYIDKHITTKDSLAETRKEGVQISADRLSAETTKTENKVNDVKRSVWFIIMISVILLVIAGISIARIKKKKSKFIEQKEQEIRWQEQQINALHDTRLDKIQEEAMLLAKENSPEFLSKFKEAYPGFYQSILHIEPNLKNSELIFCAYLKLNFGTKEIATYTFVTPRAIQIRKNRLRKKLNIPSDNDIYQWMDDLG